MTELKDWAKQARDEHQGRLLARIEIARAKLDALPAQPAYAAQQRILLDRAEAAARGKAIDAAWQLFAASERLTISGYSAAELAAQSHILLLEADDKLGSWRKQAVRTLLAGTPTIEALQAATRIRDERNENLYRQQALVKGQLQFFAAILVSVLVGAALLTKWIPLDLASGSQREAFMGFIFLTGVAGAAVSALRSTAVGSRTPDMVLAWYISAARLLVGGAAALVLDLALQAKLVAIVNDTAAGSLLVAFAAGFSERLLLSALNKLPIASDPKASKPDQPARTPSPTPDASVAPSPP